VVKFAVFIERQKVKSVSALRDFAPTLLTRGSTPGLCCGLRSQTPVYRVLTVAVVGGSNFLAPALIKRIYARALIFLTRVNSLTC